MTLADTRSDVSSAESGLLSSNQLEMMRAFFCYEFEVSRLDRESVPAVTEDAVEEWIDALGSSGLFAPAELRSMGAAWRAAPEALIDLLVGDVDEVAARRDVPEVEVVGTEPSADRTAAFLRAS